MSLVVKNKYYIFRVIDVNDNAPQFVGTPYTVHLSELTQVEIVPHVPHALHVPHVPHVPST